MPGNEPVEHVVDAKQVEDDQQASLVRAETLAMDVEASELEIAADVDKGEDGNIVRREGSAASTIIMESSLGKVSAASTEVMEDLEEEKERVRVQKIRDVILKKREEIELIKERVSLYEAKRHLLD